jgi:hypothetical protein
VRGYIPHHTRILQLRCGAVLAIPKGLSPPARGWRVGEPTLGPCPNEIINRKAVAASGKAAASALRSPAEEGRPPLHDAAHNPDAPAKPIRVMDCAGKAPAATALSPARPSRELLRTVARTKTAWHYASRRAPLLDPRPDRGCVADQPQRLRRNDRAGDRNRGWKIEDGGWHGLATLFCMRTPFRIPTGFRLKAQGCRSGYLGSPVARMPTATRLWRDCLLVRQDGRNRVAVEKCCVRRLPRVARASRPWALRHNPFGIERVVPPELTPASNACRRRPPSDQSRRD